MYIYVYDIHMYICTYTCIHTYVHIYMYTPTHTHAHTCTHKHSQAHIQTHKHTHTHTHTHTQTHTHTHTHTRARLMAGCGGGLAVVAGGRGNTRRERIQSGSQDCHRTCRPRDSEQRRQCRRTSTVGVWVWV